MKTVLPTVQTSTKMSADRNSNLNCDDFKIVSYKNKLWKSKPKHLPKQNPQSFDAHFDKEATLRRITDAKLEVSTTDLFDSVKASIDEGLSALNNPSISEIICLGLGRIGECTIARYQLALLLCLKELYNVDVFAFDPVFKEHEKDILSHFNFKILEENLEGKHKICDDKTRLFFLPHCPKQLTNNLLWANWGLNLRYCVIVSNSFNNIIENCSAESLIISGEYISKISPYTLELPVINSFKYYEVFNDTAVHIFPKLNLISQDLWENCPEPEYLDEDLEFITDKTRNLDPKLK